MLKKVLIQGPLLSQSGYGVHSRQVFRSLLNRKDIDLYVKVTSWGETSWLINDNLQKDLINNIVLLANKKNSSFNISYQIGLPHEWINISPINIGITAGFETNIVKKSWIDNVNSMTKVIVPSEFTKRAFVNTSNLFGINIQTPIEVINEAYYDYFEDDHKSVINIDEKLKYDKNILIMGQITSNEDISDRKNTYKTLKTAIDFVKDKDIGVLLKVNTGKYSLLEKNILLDNIKKRFSLKEREKIQLIFGNVSIEELYDLYNCKKISCFLSGTRGEGWGLSFIESAVSGLPIIATNHSAYKEYLKDSFLGVDYNLKKLDFFSNNFIDENQEPTWAEFCEVSMIECLDKFFDKETFYKKISLDNKEKIKQNYNISKILKEYNYFFENLL